MSSHETPADYFHLDSITAAVIDAAPDAVVVMDRLGRVAGWNRRASELFGFTRHEALGMQLSSLIVPPESREAHHAGLERYLSTGEAVVLDRRIELVAIRKNGQRFPVEAYITSARNGEAFFFTAFLRDISDWRQKSADEAAQTRRVLYKQQAAALSLGAMSFEEAMAASLDLISSIMQWPVGHVLIPDANEQTLVSTDIWHGLADESSAAIKSAVEPTRLAPGEGIAGQAWHANAMNFGLGEHGVPAEIAALSLPTGPIRALYAIPISDGDCVIAVLEFFGSEPIEPDRDALEALDIIRQKLGQSLERNRNEEVRARLAAIVDSSLDAIIGRTFDGKILSWNLGAERIYGYTADEAIGRTMSLISLAEPKQDEPQLLDVLVSGRRLDQFETRRRRKDGTIVDVSISAGAVRDSKGQIIGAATIERDVTRRIAEQRELKDAIDAAQVASRTKSEFLANVSHELRTPMNAIVGMTGLALRERLAPHIRDYLETVRESADTLLSLLNDILDFSRMEAGRFDLEHEPFQLQTTLEETMRSLSLRAHEKGLELACDSDQDGPLYLVGDERRFRQVILNLVGNAIKFTEQGEVVVTARSMLLDDHTAEIHITVADTGIGISYDDQKKIFSPFTQVDASTTRRFSGAGLGLTISQELVEMMGGRIWVESDPGVGSRFHFTCQMELAQQPIDADEMEASTDSLRGLPVLVVDDNATNRRILLKTLIAWDMKPVAVSDGASALAELRRATKTREPYTLVLVDALMPHMDGFMLIEAMTQDRHLPKATIVMLSSADRQAFGDRHEQLPIAAYLEKPISQSSLHAALVAAVQGSKPARPRERKARPSSQPLRVLLAEDTPANQKVVRAILQTRGHRVALAHNGREAVERALAEPFDVILMDVQMPTMDGYQATAAIRNAPDPRRANIPILALTAHAMRGDRERCIEAGMDAYIAKPIDAEQLINTVESLVDRDDEGAEEPPMLHASQPEPEKSNDPQSPIAKLRNELQQIGEERMKRNQTPAPTQTPKPILNKQAALDRMGGDEELFRELALFFLEDAPGLVDNVAQGLNEGAIDLGKAGRAAHSLKGLAANFDAYAVVTAAMNVEDACRHDDARSALAQLPSLQSSLAVLLAALEPLTKK